MKGRGVGRWLALSLSVVIYGCGPETPLATGTALADLDEGWSTLRTGARTSCGDGSEYHFFVRPGDPERILFYLHGGGVCWSAGTCADGPTGTGVHSIIPAFHPDRQWGILDSAHPQNALSEFSVVMLPYCTSDLHLGNRDATYHLDQQVGEGSSLTIRHRGMQNASASLEWVFENFENPQQVVVTGSSAGAMAVPFYAAQVARRYRQARVVGIGDDAGAFRSDSAKDVLEENWGWPEALERHPGWEEYGGAAPGTELLYKTAARGPNNLELYQVNHAHDRDQAWFLGLAGADVRAVHPIVKETMRDIRNVAPFFRSFTLGGTDHTVLNRPSFYFSTSDGHRLSDWMAAIVGGDSVSTVECRSCARPIYEYSRPDSLLMERTLDRLSRADRWNAEDEGRPCSAERDRFTLRCAILLAAEEVRAIEPPPHGSFAAWYDLRETAESRLGASAGGLVPFNNHDSTTFDDVLALLIEVRDRVRLGIEADSGSS